MSKMFEGTAVIPFSDDDGLLDLICETTGAVIHSRFSKGINLHNYYWDISKNIIFHKPRTFIEPMNELARELLLLPTKEARLAYADICY